MAKYAVPASVIATLYEADVVRDGGKVSAAAKGFIAAFAAWLATAPFEVVGDQVGEKNAPKQRQVEPPPPPPPPES